MNSTPTSAFRNPMSSPAELAGWARETRLASNGMRLFYYDSAEAGKPTALLLHGLGDEADTWRRVLPLISAGYRVIAPDLPGFGRSDPLPAGGAPVAYVDALIELLNALAIPRATWVGHSMGGILAHWAAIAHPQRVERLVLVGGALTTQPQKLNLAMLLFLTPGVGEWIYTRLRKDPQAAYRSLESYYYRLDALPEADREFLYQRVNERVWSDKQRRGFFTALRGLARWLPARQKTLPGRLSGWSIPTVIVWGEADRVNDPAGARALAALLPEARVVITPGAGHNVQQEQPEVVARAILEESTRR